MKQIISISKAKYWLKYRSQKDIGDINDKVNELVEWGKSVSSNWGNLEFPLDSVDKVKSFKKHKRRKRNEK